MGISEEKNNTRQAIAPMSSNCYFRQLFCAWEEKDNKFYVCHFFFLK